QGEPRPVRGYSMALGNVRWPRLPGTAEEARAVAAKLKAYTRQLPTVRLGKEALESAVKSARRPRVLVFCTHGFFLEDQTGAAPPARLGERGLKLTATQAPRQGKPSARPLENPLLRCGLVFAGANHRPVTDTGKALDDGLLTGLEIVG